MKKRERPTDGAVKVLADPAAEKMLPNVWEHLTATRYDDGSPRQTGTLLVFAQDGILKGMLRDKDAGLCGWVAAASWGGLFKAMDAFLADPNAEWRVDRQADGQQAKRVRKSP